MFELVDFLFLFGWQFDEVVYGEVLYLVGVGEVSSGEGHGDGDVS